MRIRMRRTPSSSRRADHRGSAEQARHRSRARWSRGAWPPASTSSAAAARLPLGRQSRSARKRRLLLIVKTDRRTLFPRVRDAIRELHQLRGLPELIALADTRRRRRTTSTGSRPSPCAATLVLNRSRDARIELRRPAAPAPDLASRSSTSSIPTEIRTRPSVTPMRRRSRRPVSRFPWVIARGVRDQRLDTAEALRERAPGTADRGTAARAPAFRRSNEIMPPKPVHLAPGQTMLRMAGQPRE